MSNDPMYDKLKKEGVKYDGDRARFDLIDPLFMDGLAKVLTFGAEKYEDWNWAKGMKWHRPFRAALNHLWKWWLGQEIDPDSGLHHLDHAACNIMFLAHYQHYKVGDDDRFIQNNRLFPGNFGDYKKLTKAVQYGHVTMNPDGSAVKENYNTGEISGIPAMRIQWK